MNRLQDRHEKREQPDVLDEREEQEDSDGHGLDDFVVLLEHVD